MPTKTYVRVVEDGHDGPALQEFTEEGSPVGPVFTPIHDLRLVSKQIEIVRAACNDMERVPGDTVAVMKAPARLEPVIVLHMKAVDFVDPDIDERSQLYNHRTGNMRFQWFTHRELREDITVTIRQDDTCDERPVLAPTGARCSFPSYEIRLRAPQFDAVLGQIEAARRCLVTVDLHDPTGVYTSSWQEPAKLFGSNIASRKADGSVYDATIPHFGIASFMDLQVSTFPDIQPIETVYLRRLTSDRIDAMTSNTKPEESNLSVPALTGGAAEPQPPRETGFGMVKLLLWLIALLLFVIAVKL